MNTIHTAHISLSHSRKPTHRVEKDHCCLVNEHKLQSFMPASLGWVILVLQACQCLLF